MEKFTNFDITACLLSNGVIPHIIEWSFNWGSNFYEWKYVYLYFSTNLYMYICMYVCMIFFIAMMNKAAYFVILQELWSKTWKTRRRDGSTLTKAILKSTYSQNYEKYVSVLHMILYTYMHTDICWYVAYTLVPSVIPYIHVHEKLCDTVITVRKKKK